MVGERTPLGNVENVPGAKPPHREHRWIARGFDGQTAVRRQRRDGLGLERRAAEELPERRLQQVVVESAGGEDRRERSQLAFHHNSLECRAAR